MKVLKQQLLTKHGKEMVNKQFLLYGGSGHAKVIAECIEANGDDVIGIFDDNKEMNSFKKIPVFGPYQKVLHKHPVIISIGDNRTREALSKEVDDAFGTVIHPSAHISPSADIGEGSVIMCSSIIQVDSQLGKHVIVNSGASIDHECVIDDYVHICPQTTLCGNVSIGKGAMVGAGTIVIPGIKIGKWAIIGAGSVIIRDVPDYAVVVGNPGRIIKDKTSF
ncbi:acetyltransferase [Carboxylicivirga marina]|uniref:acetyltransferase n=1 Tax=Carboxylicivirga marina TaxID=2800988 RepID=UPI0025982489|nr:acetyltransferase [uncultured Carboxylicivirga sp.]